MEANDQGGCRVKKGCSSFLIILPLAALANPQRSKAAQPRRPSVVTPVPSEPSAYERMIKKEEQEHRDLSKCVSDDVIHNSGEIGRNSTEQLLGSARERAEARRSSELRELRPDPCSDKKLVWEQTKTWLITNDPPKGIKRFDPDDDTHMTYEEWLEAERRAHLKLSECSSESGCNSWRQLWERSTKWLSKHQAPQGVRPFDPNNDVHE
jgi:hypothetical protein